MSVDLYVRPISNIWCLYADACCIFVMIDKLWLLAQCHRCKNATVLLYQT